MSVGKTQGREERGELQRSTTLGPCSPDASTQRFMVAKAEAS